MSDTGPLFVSSGDLIADRRYKWALDQAARGDFAAAAEILLQTVALAPAFATAWFALGTIRERLGDLTGAIAALENARDADPADYHGARLQLARLASGDATPAMSETYVRRLFDQYAGRYDVALTERLAYRGPALLHDAVETAMTAAGRPLRFGSMLDLGCGTGLAGAAFRPLVDWLIGVDLASAMIAQAQTKGLYDRLVTADVVAFLADAAGQAARHHLVVAADVFVYVNDLAPAVAGVARVLAPDGVFAFTVETHQGDGAKLLPTLRYAHGAPYIHRTLADAGLTPVSVRDAAVRSEKGVPVDSLVVVAQPA
ncbi:MAG TPA: methyltransferase domain-containing protein [Xanthobacteraceae bacterium]|nr:methyltransferase domain-containing protein [Xanthobacteraceae bacterium]